MKPSLVGTAFFTAVTATELLISGTAQAVLIDDFNGGYGEVTGNDIAVQEYFNAWGGQRTLQIDGSSDDRLSVELETVNGINGILWHENGDSSPNDSLVRWGGGASDFTDGGSSDRFAIEFLSVRPDDQFSLTVDSGANSRSVDFTVDGPSTKFILFSDFGLLPSDFEAVSQVELNITGISQLSSIQFKVPDREEWRRYPGWPARLRRAAGHRGPRSPDRIRPVDRPWAAG